MLLKATKILLIVTALIVIMLGAILFYAYRMIGPLDRNNQIKQVFEIKSGESTREIAGDLTKEGLIGSDWPFLLMVRFVKEPIQAGVYELSPGMSSIEIYKIVASGKSRLEKVTIPEGYRVEQIGQRLSSDGYVDYNEFVSKAKKYEGELFPDTYYFSTKSTVDDLTGIMHSNYQKKVESLNLTGEDLIIASIVEREAINDAERPIIAGIYKNRLKLGMKLEADPTVQFGRDNNEIAKLSKTVQSSFKFWSPVTLADYQSVNSSYNTYLIAGLPPDPICNPGIASIEATINYTRHDYLYFLQHDGKIYPAKTEAEHNRNRVKILGAKLEQ